MHGCTNIYEAALFLCRFALQQIYIFIHVH